MNYRIKAITGIFVVLVLAVFVFSMVHVGASDYADGHAGKCATLSLNGPGTLVGTNGKDCLAGSNGPDIVKAKGGNDVVAGNHGPDILKGSGGDDRLWGGRGPDTFICGDGYDVVNNRRGTGHDTVSDDCEEVRT